MLTNTDATLYHRRYNPVTRLDEWESTYIPALWWYEAEQSSVTTEGRKTADAYTVRIPYITVLVKKDDYLVKGQCSVQMKTAKDLAGTEHFKVSAANDNRYGGNPHIKVTGGA